MKTFRYDWKLVDRNCPEYGMCPVYGELTLYLICAYDHADLSCFPRILPTLILFITTFEGVSLKWSFEIF